MECGSGIAKLESFHNDHFFDCEATVTETNVSRPLQLTADPHLNLETTIHSLQPSAIDVTFILVLQSTLP